MQVVTPINDEIWIIGQCWLFQKCIVATWGQTWSVAYTTKWRGSVARVHAVYRKLKCWCYGDGLVVSGDGGIGVLVMVGRVDGGWGGSGGGEDA